MATVNLWPDEITADNGLEGPIVVLKEQAVLLGQTTKNLVEAQVESDPTNEDGSFTDRFVVYSSAINYRYELFYLTYPFEFYPAEITLNEKLFDPVIGSRGNPIYPTLTKKINSREELELELRKIFYNPKTIRMIQAILARSRE